MRGSRVQKRSKMMKKLVAICLTLAMLSGLCCFGNAFAAAENSAAPAVIAS